MAKITQDMRDIAEKTIVYLFSTASKEGKPNGVPVTLVRVGDDDEVMVMDTLMHKTRQNIAENPLVSVAYWSRDDRYGYQLKGRARVETSGETFDDGVRWAKTKLPNSSPKAAIIIKVEEAYYVGSGKDSSINLAE